MGQDVMPSGLASPSLPHLPPRQQVFIPGLYSDVEFRLDRVDSGIDALRRRVRDFDGLLDGQIRRCESAEDRVRTLRDDFSRIDREITEMSAELNSTFDNGDNETVEDQLEYDCNINVSTRNSLRPDSLRTDQEQIIPNSADFVQNQEDLSSPVSNRTNTHGVTIRINAESQPEESTPPNTNGCENSKESTTCNREQSPIQSIDNSGSLIHQENNLVSIGVICNVNEPTEVPAGSSECSRCVSEAEQQLLDMAQDFTDFRREVSSSTKIDNLADDCLLEARFSHEEEGVERVQETRKEEHLSKSTSANVDVENEEYAAFDSYVQEIIKRHSSENCEDLVESTVNLRAETCSEQTDQHLCHNESQSPAGNADENQSDRRRDDVNRSSQNGVRSAEVTIDSQQCDGQVPDSPDLTSSTTLTADEYNADEASGIFEPCHSQESRSRNVSASQSSHARRRNKSGKRNKCANVQFKHRGRRASRGPHCCLRNVLATYVHRFLELLHSRVTKEVKKGSKGKKHHSGSERRHHVSNDDIVRARDAVFDRIGLTVPSLEVLLKFDQDNQECVDHAQIDPVYVTDDEVHKLLVLMGTSWHTMNDRLHENDRAFRVAIATVHADSHQAE
ncbi:uncharacterized protein [Asterias amurensis]|uniref:uncharacterized protein n=1 Tax=Asterias amurensis TaxID=7602 RepID=UPI003AB67503